ncbi:hypothetical protein SEA_DAUDAU_41 [Streptomyces phage Daudau]|uniref:Uncharacterized protein n=1 Tax=Streptomyces phage Daudau TaxID=2041206 RepID=A0A291LH55_9CAUD|nr:hypothetical protein KGG88_gp41 [Streptomyces phage Daudau]ATI18742.1 hypothetical protein SEA_DAUDAU_41 [Streptomyces phage Daudau]
MAAENETTETASKKTTRKPDPVTQLLNDVRAQIKALGDVSVLPYPAHQARAYDDRARAWNRQYGKAGTYDGLILSLAFEALAALNPAERRYAFTQLAAAALIAVDKLDGAE